MHNKLIRAQHNKLMVCCEWIYKSNILSLNPRRAISLFCFHCAAKIVHLGNKIRYWDELRVCMLFYRQNKNTMFLFCVQNKMKEVSFFTCALTCTVEKGYCLERSIYNLKIEGDCCISKFLFIFVTAVTVTDVTKNKEHEVL